MPLVKKRCRKTNTPCQCNTPYSPNYGRPGASPQGVLAGQQSVTNAIPASRAYCGPGLKKTELLTSWRYDVGCPTLETVSRCRSRLQIPPPPKYVRSRHARPDSGTPYALLLPVSHPRYPRSPSLGHHSTAKAGEHWERKGTLGGGRKVEATMRSRCSPCRASGRPSVLAWLPRQRG